MTREPVAEGGRSAEKHGSGLTFLHISLALRLTGARS